MIQSGVSEVDVLDIVDRFNPISLYAVYTRLDLTQTDIDHALLTHPHFPEQRAKLLLNLWRDRRAGEATRGTMIAAITKCLDCKRDMDKLIRYWNTGRWTGDTTEPGKGNEQ